MRRQPETRRMKVADLAPAEYNPRTISDEAMKGLRASLKRFGLVQPVVWNMRSERVVGGHQRLKVLLAEGIEDTEVIVVDLPRSEEKALNASLNNPAIAGEFTDELEALLSEVNEHDPELFGELLLDKLLADAVSPPTEGQTAPDAVPDPPAQPVSVRGELYQLGNHRLLCGDATMLPDVEHLMGGEKAALFATDPPYLVDYTGADRPNESGKDWSDRYHEVEIRDAMTFFRTVFSNATVAAREDAAWYCWHAHKRAALIEQVWESLGVLNHQQIVWVKPSALHGYSFWPYRHEPCLMGWKRGHKPAHDGDNTHAVTTVWECDWEGARRVVGNEHPTQKPVELFARPMRKHTRAGQICYEPFGGSGSQIIAAEATGRRCYAMEIEPIFCDVIRRRWAEFVEGEGADWQTMTAAVVTSGGGGEVGVKHRPVVDAPEPES
jgi:DNA modification methylase